MKILKNINALYVDDDQEAALSMQKTLGYYFKNVYIANNGKEGIELFETYTIGIIFSDYDMPVMNGCVFIREIREKNKFIPAVIISSYSDKEKLLSAIKLNLVEYLVRPFELSRLKITLQECANWIEKYTPENISLSQTLTYDSKSKSFTSDSDTVALTKFEASIFEYLLENEYKVITFDTLIENLDYPNTSRKSIVNTIYKLNKKLAIPLIYNMKDVGYMLKREQSA